MFTKFLDRTGMHYERLIAQWPIGKAGKSGHIMWLCSCECGKLAIVSSSNLGSGAAKSCGCLRNEKAAQRGISRTIHGHTSKDVGRHSAEYAAFSAARQRCNNPSAQAYANYGGRGIKFLFQSFEEFFAEVGPRPNSDYSLDRIDNDKHYEPGNVRWATAKEQTNNRRSAFGPKSAICHPDRPHCAKGLCRSCYGTQHHQQRKATIC